MEMLHQLLEEAWAKVEELRVWEHRVYHLECLIATYDGSEKISEKISTEEKPVMNGAIINPFIPADLQYDDDDEEKPKKKKGRPPKKRVDEDEDDYASAPVTVSRLSDDERCDSCNSYSLSLSNTRDGRICRQCL